jgi:hypothetical protein
MGQAGPFTFMIPFVNMRRGLVVVGVQSPAPGCSAHRHHPLVLALAKNARNDSRRSIQTKSTSMLRSRTINERKETIRPVELFGTKNDKCFSIRRLATFQTNKLVNLLEEDQKS